LGKNDKSGKDACMPKGVRASIFVHYVQNIRLKRINNHKKDKECGLPTCPFSTKVI
jgi:hypothetical protein